MATMQSWIGFEPHHYFHITTHLDLVNRMNIEQQNSISNGAPLETFKPIAPNGEKHYTACLGVEGNGPNFSAHIGAYIALLEHNILPIATIGGSSGAVTGSFLMSLLENPSLETIPLDRKQPSFSKSQKAAIILAASDSVLNSFIFFPNLGNFRKTLINWLRNFLAFHYQDKLVANANVEVIHVENMVGQVAIALDFFRTADFETVIHEPVYANREQLLKQLWMNHSGAIKTSVRGLIDAFNRSSQNQATAFEADIVQRFLQLSGRSLSWASQSQPSPEAQLATQESRKAKAVFRLAKLLYQHARKQAYVPGRITLKRILQQKIVLLDPCAVRAGHQGFSKSGAFLKIPKGMVIHSTFRSGDKKDFRLQENSGWENLYQGYFPASNLMHEFTCQWQGQSNYSTEFLSSVQEGKVQRVIPPERTLILAQDLHQQARGFSFALQATSAETGYFRRSPFQGNALDRQLNPHLPSYLFSFGGWLEKTPISTIAHLATCKQADYFVTLRRRDSVTWFARKAFHSVLGQKNKKQTKTLFSLMQRFVQESTSLSGQKGNIHVVFDNEWNNPILNGNENFFVKDLLVGLLPNRKAHMLIGYLEVTRILRSQPNQFESNVLPWGLPVPLSLSTVGRKAKQMANQEFWSFLSRLA